MNGSKRPLRMTEPLDDRGNVLESELDAELFEAEQVRERIQSGLGWKPVSLGIGAWPAVPRGTPWKEGVMQALGWGGDTAAGWRRVLSAAASYADLEPALLGRVEELIDFVTSPGTSDPAADV